jgi:hypothetical protein
MGKLLVELGSAVGRIAETVRAWNPPGIDRDKIAILIGDVTGSLLDQYLSTMPRLRAVLVAVGVLKSTRAEEIAADERVVRRADVSRLRLDFDALTGVLTKPRDRLDALLNGAADDVADIAGPILERALLDLGIPAIYGMAGRARGYALSPEELATARRVLIVDLAPLLRDADEDAAHALRLAAVLTDDTGGKGLGFALSLIGQLSVGSGALTAKTTGIGSILVTKSGAELDLKDGATGIELDIEYSPQAGAGEPLARLGSATGLRLEIGTLKAAAKLAVAASGLDLSASADVKQLKIVVAPGDDGFLAYVLPSAGLSVGADLALAWGLDRGIRFKGSGSVSIPLPADIEVGPASILGAMAELRFGDAGIGARLTADVAAHIGPIAATVQGVGVRATFAGGDGFVSVGFQPPNGVGLAVDAGMVKGGGSLTVDREHGRYAGTAELEIADELSLAALAIVSTRMPDGSKGFSFKLLGCVEFPNCPVQLGMGFVLSGVGLAVAIECRMDEGSLRNAVYDGSLRSLLFPEDLVVNGPKILGDIESFFPAQRNAFVLGIMARLGWGGGVPIVTADVGLFIEKWRSIRIALAAIISSDLPNAHSPVLQLHAQVLGLIDFEAKTLSVDASLSGSKLLDWALDGDLALRSGWGESRRFALACGGFYPGYAAPPGFPSLRRISLAVGDDNPRVGFQAFFAVTENSVQLGAELDAHYHKHVSVIGTVELSATAGFDALFKFNPFFFEATMYAGATVRAAGETLMSVDLSMDLTGPNPYHIKGKAKVEICHVGVNLHFETDFGPKRPVIDDQGQEVDALVKAELDRNENWQSVPDFRGTVPLLRPNETLADPLCRLQFVQRAVPLGLEITRVGNKNIEPTTFTLQPVEEITGAITSIQEYFAPGEYLTLTDDQRISSKPFELYDAGAAATWNKDEVDPESAESVPMVYETVYPADLQPPKKPKPRVVQSGRFLAFAELLGGRYHARAGEAIAGPAPACHVTDQKFTFSDCSVLPGPNAAAGHDGVTFAGAANRAFSHTSRAYVVGSVG